MPIVPLVKLTANQIAVFNKGRWKHLCNILSTVQWKSIFQSHPLTKLERRDRFLGFRDDGLLTSDRFQFFGRNIKYFSVAARFAEAHVDDYLLDLRDRHWILNIEFLGQRRCDLFFVFVS